MTNSTAKIGDIAPEITINASASLEPVGNRTKLRFSESSVGKISETGMQQKDEGWHALCEALKQHAEARNIA